MIILATFRPYGHHEAKKNILYYSEPHNHCYYTLYINFHLAIYPLEMELHYFIIRSHWNEMYLKLGLRSFC